MAEGLTDHAPFIAEAARVFATPNAYRDEAQFHEAAALLRAQCPLPYVEVDGYPPFYAVTRYRDIQAISTDHKAWRNEPRSVLMPLAVEEAQRRAADLKTSSTSTTRDTDSCATSPPNGSSHGH